jgi:hypothetical protein
VFAIHIARQRESPDCLVEVAVRIAEE